MNSAQGWCSIAFQLSICVWSASSTQHNASGANPELCRIEIRDAENDWPVPLVELRTVSQLRFVSDNAGVIALDAPELLDRECFFHVKGHGYEVPADGFGFQGVRFTPRASATHKILVTRKNIAKRLGRLTGSGLYAESQRFGAYSDWKESPVVGCDSIQMTLFKGTYFLSWGDTLFAHYPLGNFDMTGATVPGPPVAQNQPPITPHYNYFLDDRGRTRGVAPIAGKGPTWLTGYASLPDRNGREHLVAFYRKIEGMLTTYECGLCEWDENEKRFQAVAKLWSKADGQPEPKLVPSGHTIRWQYDSDRAINGKGNSAKKAWLIIGDPFPCFRCPATFEAWSNPKQWEHVETPVHLMDIKSNAPVKPHSGSIAWSEYRKRWVTVFMQAQGEPSALGELWFAEADSPFGPWGPAIKVLTHDNYTFYNPRLWGEFASANSPVLLFEGTYTEQFAKSPAATPRYDYNQLLYRLDLDDPKLRPVQTPVRAK